MIPVTCECGIRFQSSKTEDELTDIELCPSCLEDIQSEWQEDDDDE